MSQPYLKGWKEYARELLAQKDIYGFAVTLVKLKMCAVQNQQMEVYEQVLFTEVEQLFEANQYLAVLAAIEEGLNGIREEEKRMALQEKKGMALLRLRRYTEAEAVYREILQLPVPRFQAIGYIGLSAIYRERYLKFNTSNDLNLAESFCHKAFEHLQTDQPLWAEAVVQLGKVYGCQGKYEKAIEAFTGANNIYQQKNPAILNELALAYAGLQDAEYAFECSESAETQAAADKDTYEEARSLQIKGYIEDYLLEDFIRAKDYYLSAYYKYLEVDAFEEAFALVLHIAEIDQAMVSENLKLLQSRVVLAAGKL